MTTDERDERKTMLEDISSVIGLTATLTLVAWYGDLKRLYVPKGAEADCVLARLIGQDHAKRLSAEWGGEHLSIPQIHGYDVEVRRSRTARLLQQGFGAQEIAVLLGVSERRIQQISRELEAQGLIAILLPKKRLVKVTPGNEAVKLLEKVGHSFRQKQGGKSAPTKRGVKA